MVAPPGVTIDLSNVQGILPSFYPGCAYFQYLIFGFESPEAGRGFLASLAPLVSPSVLGKESPPASHVNLGVSFAGLQALGVKPDILNQFPDDFIEGPSAAAMGDYGESSPENWWSKKLVTAQIHAVVILSCPNDGALGASSARIRALAERAGVKELIPTTDGSRIDGQFFEGGRVHFGYRDGISEPDIAWSDNAEGVGKINFRSFLLGYSTPDASSSPKVSSQAGSQDAANLARDGCYAVFKWIYQDVARFNRFLAEEGPKVAPDRSAEDAQELLAAKLIGRWRDGTPLVLSPDAPNSALANANEFGYATDRDGAVCPLSAHIRVVNPRDQELFSTEPKIIPRVIRRGTPFGAPLEGTVDDGKLRGLAGIFLCASISRQIYQLMGWMKRTDFDPKFTNFAGQDPLANRDVPGSSPSFPLVGTNGQQVSLGLLDFTRTLGAAFFLIPSISGLRQLAEGTYVAEPKS